MVDNNGWTTSINDAAKSNGSHPHSWTPAKPGSTTTTAPNDSCAHPTTNPNPRPTTNPTQLNPHRPNRPGMAAAANRNRSTPRATTTPISPVDPRRPTTKRP